MEIIFVSERCKVMELNTCADIVQYSFLVQKSISPLNLELCQSPDVFDDRTKKCQLFSSKPLINTEEKCRKIFFPDRTIMYTLHLDLPRGGEKSLKMNPGHLIVTGTWKAEISIRKGFYADIIYSLIHYECIRNKNNLKVLKWLLKFDAVEKSLFCLLPCSIINYFLECMHSEQDDNEFLTESVRKLDIINWLFNARYFKSEIFRNYLYQIRRNSCIRNGQFVDFCISLSSSQIARNVLELKSGPAFSENLYFFYVDEIYETRAEYPSVSITLMSRQRGTLLLQLFWICIINWIRPQERLRFLRLIWRSVPDSFLSSSEITGAFEDGFTSEEITDICNIYSKAVGELPEFARPRRLQHYSRTAIRRIISQNRHWLPEAIKKLDLPKELESYLNLEE